MTLARLEDGYGRKMKILKAYISHDDLFLEYSYLNDFWGPRWDGEKHVHQ
jgi:hypothetical protein